nr:dihydrolipoyl dehydrogenase [Lautropia sp.]
MSVIEIAVPDIGDFSEVEVIEVLIKPGDEIALEQSLITVESDKASMEIPSPAAGRLQELTVKVGDKIAKGSLIGTLEPAESGAAQPAAPAAPSPAQPPASSAAQA